MAKRIYRHNVYIESESRVDSSRLKALKEGTLLTFSYQGQNISDRTPLILLLWNDYKKYKVHGINLNYLSHSQMLNVFKKFLKQGITLNTDSQKVYDSTSEYRNLVKDPYSRIMLPTFNESSTGNLGKQEAEVKMDRLYDRILKSFLKKEDVYRTYMSKKITRMSIVEMNFKKLMRV
tara:strand:- start:11 stop:541 length:531 start_codon:yes stop_codon:yes gene_type:complete